MSFESSYSPGSSNKIKPESKTQENVSKLHKRQNTLPKSLNSPPNSSNVYDSFELTK